jgi:flavin-dependent dehydrogenase
MKYVDYIIVGGGISGSVLSYTLMKYGASVHVFDLPEENKSSIVASGLWNPVVLKRMKKVWKGR